jgi:2-dehydropantoate 2-reductase
MKKYKVGIVGSGGVGLTCAAFIANSASVMIKTRRPEQAASLNTEGVTLVRNNGDTSTIANITASSDADILADCDVILITVKSYDSKETAQEIRENIKDDAEIISLQNGIEAVPILKEVFSNPDRVFAGVTWVGATRIDDTTVKLGTLTTTVIDPAATLATQVLNASDYDSNMSDNIKQYIWDKLSLNVGQNALGAITNLNLQQLGDSEHCIEIATHLLDEFEKVANAEGIHFQDSLMEKLLQNWDGSPHRPSMWQDLDAGKRTEIDALNGAIVQLGKKHAIDTPYNLMITQLIKSIEPQ